MKSFTLESVKQTLVAMKRRTLNWGRGISVRGITESPKAQARSRHLVRFAAIALAGCFTLSLNPASAQTARPDFVLPATCGAFEREGFEFTRGQIANDENADFESGLPGPDPFDPLVIEPLVQRDAATGVVSFFSHQQMSAERAQSTQVASF